MSIKSRVPHDLNDPIAMRSMHDRNDRINLKIGQLSTVSGGVSSLTDAMDLLNEIITIHGLK